MGTLEQKNPFSVLLFFICVITVTVFCFNPVTALMSLCGAVLFRLIAAKNSNPKEHIFAVFILLILSIGNPLFYHNGKTVLFVFKDSPITLEALIYGVCSGIMLCASYYWFKNFSDIFTTDKILYVLGKTSPKIALVLSVSLRFIPLLAQKSKQTEEAAICSGIYTEKTFFDKIKSKINIFSAMLTYATENAIITADSMEAKGYVGKRRTSYSSCGFTASDVLFTAAFVICSVPIIIMTAARQSDFVFYPVFTPPEISVFDIFAYSFFAIFCIIPFLCEAGDKIKWKYLQSKI